MEKILRKLDNDGYYVFHDFISSDKSSIIRSLLEALDHNSLVGGEGSSFHGSGTMLAPNIITHHDEFLNLATDIRILDVAKGYFKLGAFPGESDPFQLHLMHARMVEENAPPQELHIDSRLCGVNPPLVLHIFIYLDDCLKEGTGATVVVPGSHKYTRYSNMEDSKSVIPIFGSKGTAIILNSNLYHGSSLKTSPGRRWILTLAYSRWWMRQPFAIPYFKNWPRKLSDREKALFGFNNYGESTWSIRGLKSRGPLPKLVPEE